MKPDRVPTLSSQLLWIAAATAAILLANFLAMQLTDEVAWDPFDFLAATLLLMTAGTLYVLVSRRLRRRRNRMWAALAVTALLVLVWAELAVGIVGSRFAGS